MSNVWERFDSIVKAEDVVEARVQFKPIDAGVYQAVLEELAPAESKAGLPMLKGRFRTTENKVIFYNQMLQNASYPEMTAKNIAEAVEFVSTLKGEDIEFTTLGAFAGEVEQITFGKTYTVTVSYGKKDLEMTFPKLKVSDAQYTIESDDEMPFD